MWRHLLAATIVLIMTQPVVIQMSRVSFLIYIY